VETTFRTRSPTVEQPTEDPVDDGASPTGSIFRPVSPLRNIIERRYGGIQVFNRFKQSRTSCLHFLGSIPLLQRRRHIFKLLLLFLLHLFKLRFDRLQLLTQLSNELSGFRVHENIL
jgi:hypothetical protein